MIVAILGLYFSLNITVHMGGTTQKQFGIPNALEYEVVDTRTTNLRGSCTGLIRNKRTGQELW